MKIVVAEGNAVTQHLSEESGPTLLGIRMILFTLNVYDFCLHI